MGVLRSWDGGGHSDAWRPHTPLSAEPRGVGLHSLSPWIRSAADQGGKSSKTLHAPPGLAQGAGCAEVATEKVSRARAGKSGGDRLAARQQ